MTGRRPSLADLALAAILGAQALALAFLVLASLALPWAPLLVLLLVAGLAGLAACWRQRPAAGAPPGPDRLARIAGAVLLAALAVFLWKLAAAPLWSWDHYAMWGSKARRMLTAGGRLDLGFLAEEEFRVSRPSYPLGLPALWRLLALGAVPDARTFKAAHALFALALAAVVRDGARRAGGSALAGNALAAAVAASPLFWDTVGLGLADLPLALWAAAAATLALRSLGGRPAAGWTAGFAAGFLPWLKDEGLPLALVLTAALAVVAAGAAGAAGAGHRRARIAWIVAPALPLALGAVLFSRLRLPQAGSFFAGDWRGRIVDRLPAVPRLLADLAALLAAPEWLGLWLVFAVAVAGAVAARNRTALALSLPVAAQLALYLAVLLAAYPDPFDHLRASGLRFTSALLPLALLAIAAWIGGRTSDPPVFRSEL